MPHIDTLSFFLGIIAAALTWWLVRKSAGFWPDIRGFLRSRAEKVKRRNITAVEDHLRREIVRRSQSQHAAWTLFSLDEIGFPPRVLAPPPHIDPGDVLPADELLSSCLAYMPDWPELPARFGAPVLDLPEVLDTGLNIALVGQPGSGKTFALAYLAAQVARKNPQIGSISNLFPIYIHASDLQIGNHEGADPLLPIIAVMNEASPVFVLPQVPVFIRSLFTGGKALLLLDGMDELPSNQVRELCSFLKAIQRDYPHTRMVVTAASDYIDGLSGLGLYPLAIAGWSDSQFKEFLQRWDHLWNEKVLPLIPGNNPASAIDPTLLSAWLQNDSGIWSPLEYTFRIWAAYAGDLKGGKPADAIEAYIRRCAPNEKLWPALERLALQMISTMQPVIGRHKADHLLVEFNSTVESNIIEPVLVASQPTNLTTDKREQPTNTIRQLITECVTNGLISEHPGDRISFNHPVISGYLAARALAQSENVASLTLQQNWSGKNQALRFLSVLDPSGIIVDNAMKEGDEPLFQGLFQAARWLKDSSTSTPWRDKLIQRLIDVVQRENLPLGTRQRAVAALVNTCDPSMPLLFRQYLESTSIIQRQLGVLGCSSLQDAKSLQAITNLQDDTSRLVRYTACMALAFMADESGINTLIQSLYEGDEDLRRAAAEALARHPRAGHPALKTGSTSDDLLVRRAVVFGLAQINMPWAIEILEKLRLEDGQWVVRNAANQAVETIQRGNSRIPRPLPIASDAGWLVTFASQQGSGISGGSMATEMLMKALKSGTEDERLAALDYLSQSTDEGIIRSVLHAIYTDSEVVSEAALVTLWRMSISGATIPSASMYGVLA